MKNIRNITIALTLMITPATYSYATNVGYVNVESILIELPQVKKSAANIKKFFAPRENIIIKLSKELQQSADEFNINKATMSEDEAKAEIEIIRKAESELKQIAAKLREDIEEKNKDILAEVQILINNAIRFVAKKHNYDIILYQKIAFATDKANITDLVSKRLETIEK